PLALDPIWLYKIAGLSPARPDGRCGNDGRACDSRLTRRSPDDRRMKRRVLVVDDDPAIVEVLHMRLESMGFDVTATGDPSRALGAIEGVAFDAALLDLRMDPVDGIELMEAIHARHPGLPVLIMTAHGTIETAVQAVQRGAFDYLTKPFVRD